MSAPPARPDPPVSATAIETTLRELADDLVLDPAPPGPGRPRILPESLLWLGMLVCVLNGWNRQRDLWRLLATTGLWDHARIPIADQTIYRRLAAGGTATLETLFRQISALLAQRLATRPARGCADLAPFAPVVVALDRTTLDPVLRTLPTLREVPPGDHALLPGSLHTAFDVRRQQFRHVRHVANPHQNEKVHARDLVADLPAGSLVLMDRGFLGFELLDDLTAAELRWIMRCPAVSTVPIHTYYRRGETIDQLVWLGATRSRKARHAVRLVQFRAGTTLYRYLTNVRDPNLLPAVEIARLYGRRWDIEMAFQLVKQHLGLHLLWSAKAEVVLQQVWAVLIIAQIAQALRLEIAARADVDVFDVSLPLVVVWLPRLAARGVDPIATLVAEGRQVEIIRPSRRKAPPDPGIPPGPLPPAPADLVLERTPRYKPKPAA